MSAVCAQENPLTAKQILEKMAKAMEVSSYQGTVVFLKNDKLEAMKYFHTVQKDSQQERLVSLNSPLREIIRNSDEVKCSFKMTQQVIVDHRPYEHSFIVDVPKNLDELETSYRFEIVGEEDVAMMPAYVVAIQPKDEFRYVRKIWISKQQYLPLKAVVYDLSGVVLEQVVFTEMQINRQEAVTSAEIAKATPAAQPAKDGLDMQNQAAFELSALPQGFKKVFFARKPIHKSGLPVDHLLLSDGFASVSVYLESDKDKDSSDSPLPEGIHAVGAINSMSRRLADSQLTVLGEVPASTVKLIAESVKLRQPLQ
ncbi:MAG: MucB/RseB C-terminal domain-containing protein [Methylococcaceae bacterium]|nr:MucB/RseB C-terminal domain-containing protein [Methylococcaceae bacterium]